MARHKPMNAISRARMLRRIAEQGPKGLARTWVYNQFGQKPGWELALQELIDAGHVDRVEVRNRTYNTKYEKSWVYCVTPSGVQACAAEAVRHG